VSADILLPKTSLIPQYDSQNHLMNPFALNIDMVSPISLALAGHHHSTARTYSGMLQDICNNRTREKVRQMYSIPFYACCVKVIEEGLLDME
jgi:hypothetical protein